MSKTSVKLTDRATCEAFLECFDTFLLDCDGVLWHKNTVIPGIRETITLLRRRGKQILFVTNNSAESRTSYLEKFKRLGIEAYHDEIFGSSYATALYLKNVLGFPADKKVYVVGGSGIADELSLVGINSEGTHADNSAMTNEDYFNIRPNPEIGAVVFGYDVSINYKKLCKAFTYLKYNEECLFILTNHDATVPAHGALFPGTGALVAPLITALDREPDKIVGKPNRPMLDSIIQKCHLNTERTCMVGDRLDTDIQFGINGGMSTLLTLTGVAKEADILGPNVSIVPNYYIDSFGKLAEIG